MVNEVLSAPSGKIRVSAPINLSRFYEDCAGHPRVEIALMLSDRSVDLIVDGYEAAIRIGGLELEADSLVRRKLKKNQLVDCA